MEKEEIKLNKANKNLQEFSEGILEDLDRDIKDLEDSSISRSYDKELNKRISE